MIADLGERILRAEEQGRLCCRSDCAGKKSHFIQNLIQNNTAAKSDIPIRDLF